MKQITEAQALAFAKSDIWKTWTHKQIVDFQLFQRFLAMPFLRFHEAMEDVLKRSVYTHEFAFSDLLKKEYLGERAAPTLEQILDLIPKDKQVLIIDEDGVGILDREKKVDFSKDVNK